MFRFFKWIIFVILTLATILWVVLTLDILKVITIDWHPFNVIREWVLSFVQGAPDRAGLIALLAGGSVFLAYNAVSLVIRKIPILGRVWGWITGIINVLSAAAIIIGVLIMVYL
ncbi:MAG: hypothetical protein RR798_00620 [Malacoplasma sp.]